MQLCNQQIPCIFSKTSSLFSQFLHALKFYIHIDTIQHIYWCILGHYRHIFSHFVTKLNLVIKSSILTMVKCFTKTLNCYCIFILWSMGNKICIFYYSGRSNPRSRTFSRSHHYNCHYSKCWELGNSGKCQVCINIYQKSSSFWIYHMML